LGSLGKFSGFPFFYSDDSTKIFLLIQDFQVQKDIAAVSSVAIEVRDMVL
jgi:hypothetical protein